MNAHAPLLLGAPVDSAEGVVVFVHGRGQTPAFIQAAVARLALPRLHYVLPAAPGNTWYPQSFLVLRADNEPALADSIATLDGVVTALAAA